MPKPKLEILVGMVASGKSTYCRKRACEGAIIINDDALATAHQAGHYVWDRDTWALYERGWHEMASVYLLAGKDVVWDSTNHTKKRRLPWLDLAHECEARPVAVVMSREDANAHGRRRFRHDPRGNTLGHWLRIAAAHDAEWESVDETEGFDEILYPPLAAA